MTTTKPLAPAGTRKNTRCNISLPGELLEALDALAANRGYLNRSNYIVGLIRLDALHPGPHEKGTRIAELPRRVRDNIDETILRESRGLSIGFEIPENVVEFATA